MKKCKRKKRSQIDETFDKTLQKISSNKTNDFDFYEVIVNLPALHKIGEKLLQGRTNFAKLHIDVSEVALDSAFGYCLKASGLQKVDVYFARDVNSMDYF